MNSRTQKNYVWDAVKESIRNEEYGCKLVSENCQKRFSGSLSVMASLAEWSVQDISFYLHHLDSKLTAMVRNSRLSMHRSLIAELDQLL
jgi:hypothetical protein